MTIISAMASNRCIGINNTIPWRISEDFKWFKQFTMNKVVVVGSTTFKTLPKLPGRSVWVLSRGHFVPIDNWPERVITDINDIPRDAVIAGGAKVYAEMFPYCDEAWITHVHKEYEGDTFMPAFEYLFSNKSLVRSAEEFEIVKYSK